MAKKFSIIVLSDATGELANSLAIAAARQFENIDVEISRQSYISTDEDIKRVIDGAKKDHAIILFTMVGEEGRRRVLTEAKNRDVVAIDIMGPTLDTLANYFHQLPSDEPGLQYKVTRDYYKRTEAVEFAVKHDEGLGITTLNQADLILVGISRTSKTPLSIYLAYRGFRCANIPVVLDMDLPKEVYAITDKKIFGLIVSPDHLLSRRSSRLKKLGRPETEDYGQIDHIQKELEHAQKMFAQIPNITIVDVTEKSIEEVASEVIHTLNHHSMPNLTGAGSTE